MLDDELMALLDETDDELFSSVRIEPKRIKSARERELGKKTLALKTKVFLESAAVDHRRLKKQTLTIAESSASIFPPKKGEQLRIRTQTSINMILLLAVLMREHASFDELIIATYTLNKEAMNIISDWVHAGKIGKLTILLPSSYSFRDSAHKCWLIEEIQALAAKIDVHAFFVWSHFKITLVGCGDRFYQIEGSMNYSQNNMAEQVLFEESKKSFDFDKSFIENIMKQHKNTLEVICE